MQTLYSLASFEDQKALNKAAIARMLDEKLDHVLDLFAVCVLYPIKVAQYAESDSLQRSSKYIRSSEDMNVDVRIATSSFVTKTLQKQSFAERIKKNKLERFIDDEWVKKVYQQLVKSTEYNSYLSAPQSSGSDKHIIQFIWEKLMLENEALITSFTDDLPGWEDNSDIIAMLMQNFFRNGNKVDFSALLSPDKKEYAHDLLTTVLEKEAYCLELIEPRLNNWDKERVAVIDMLLLRMAVCEFLYFPTIPTKVTINEYIDIAKQYSLPQSGQFVNGVLDHLLKDLEKDNMIRKQDRFSK